jgi:hypothetical protein
MLDQTKTKGTVFYPYTIRDGERADAIAFDYYDNTDYTWLIYIVNNIIDPYYDWPLTETNFDKFISKKYESSVGANDGIYVSANTLVGYKKVPYVYYINETTNQFYTEAEFISIAPSDPWNWTKTIQDDNIEISSDSLAAAISADPNSQWNEVYAYTKEQDKNDAKKFILLLDKIYANQMNQELKALLNG